MQEKKRTGELTTHSNADDTAPSVPALPAMDGIGRGLTVWHKMDVSDPGQAEALYDALNGQGEEWRQLVNHELQIENVIFSAREQPHPESGELQRVSVVTAIAKGQNGAYRVVSGTSAGVLESLQFALAMRPKLPWRPPITFRVVRKGNLIKLERVDSGLRTKAKS